MKKDPKINFAIVQPIFADITPIVSTQQRTPKSSHLITFVHS
jgi:hypothetical protein